MTKLIFPDENGGCRHYGWRVRRVGDTYVDVLLMLVNFRVVLTDATLADTAGDAVAYNGHGWCYPRTHGFARVVATVMGWDLTGDPPGEWIRHTGTHRYRVPGHNQD